ncbi:hypothetical protein F5X68DRAFT_56697, partial [Plectosphaerella plurivora]
RHTSHLRSRSDLLVSLFFLLSTGRQDRSLTAVGRHDTLSIYPPVSAWTSHTTSQIPDMQFATQRGLALLALAASTAAQSSSQNVTCYGIDGNAYANNVQCPNSFTCCNAQAKCTDQRFCQNEGQEENMFVRGPCLSQDYDAKKCGGICLEDEGFEGFIFPRVERCEDGSYCCVSTIPNCCLRGLGIFLDDKGDVISTTSSSSAASSTTTDSPSSTASNDAASTTESSAEASGTGANSGESQNGGSSSDSGSSDMGLKVGLGVGIPVAAIIGGLVAWFLIRRNKKGAAPDTPTSTAPLPQQPYDPKTDGTHYQPQEAYGSTPSPQPYGTPSPQPYGTSQAQQPGHVAEMETRPVYEMDSGAHGPQQGYYGR